MWSVRGLRAGRACVSSCETGVYACCRVDDTHVACRDYHAGEWVGAAVYALRYKRNVVSLLANSEGELYFIAKTGVQAV